MTRLRLLSVFRRGWIRLLVALIRHEPLPEGRFVPEAWPRAPETVEEEVKEGIEEEAMEAVQQLLTPPDQAAEFVTRTGIDILAPAVGSIHGCPLPMARLDIPRIRDISAATSIPLALHGGSGVGDEMVRQAIGAGIAKVNIDAEIRALYITSLKQEVGAIGTGEKVFEDLARYPRKPREVVKEAVRARIRMLRPP